MEMPCVGGQALHELTLQHLLAFMAAYPEQPKMALHVLEEGTTGSPGRVAALDAALAGTVTALLQAHPRTVLVLASEGGERESNFFFNTQSGAREAMAPALFLSLPASLIDTAPAVARAVAENQRRLVTARDVYSTLLHVPRVREGAPPDLPRHSLSLLSILPDDRDCGSAALPPRQCLCGRVRALVAAAARAVAAHALALPLTALRCVKRVSGCCRDPPSPHCAIARCAPPPPPRLRAVGGDEARRARAGGARAVAHEPPAVAARRARAPLPAAAPLHHCVGARAGGYLRHAPGLAAAEHALCGGVPDARRHGLLGADVLHGGAGPRVALQAREGRQGVLVRVPPPPRTPPHSPARSAHACPCPGSYHSFHAPIIRRRTSALAFKPCLGAGPDAPPLEYCVCDVGEKEGGAASVEEKVLGEVGSAHAGTYVEMVDKDDVLLSRWSHGSAEAFEVFNRKPVGIVFKVRLARRGAAARGA